MNRISALFIGALVALPALAGAAPVATAPDVTLEQIMAARDWIGNPPEGGFWSDDSKSVYYSVKRDGSMLRDLYVVGASGSNPHKLADSELPDASSPDGAYNLARTLKVFVRNDNLFVRNLTTGSLRQLTRYNGKKDSPSFMADGSRVQWHEGTDIYIYDLNSGITSLPADVHLEDDPAKPHPPQNYLEAEQPRLFQELSDRASNKQAQAEQQAAQQNADPTHVGAPWYLGTSISIAQSALSPNGRWLVLITQSKDYTAGAPGIMPNYITDSGYVETSKEHTYVDLNPPPAQQVKLLDLQTHSVYDLDLSQLPGIKEDPLAALRKTAVDWDVQHGMDRKAAEDSVKAPAVREVSVNGLAFSDDGNGLALQFIANDFKDRCSRGWTSRRRCWLPRNGSATKPGSTGPSTTSAGCTITTASGTCRRLAAIRNST